MGFFDQIEGQVGQVINTGSESEIDLTNLTATETERSSRAAAEPINGEAQVERTKGPRVERFKFLKPCRQCQGRGFVYSPGEGVFCSACYPEVIGEPVWAAGEHKNRDETTADPGRRITEKVSAMDPEQLPTATDQKKKKRNQERRNNFEAGLPWIMANLERLVAVGWTRAELFRMAKTSFPLGKWGLAWLGPWEKDGLRTEIHEDGRVIFTYQTNSREIKQSCFPEIYHNINYIG